MRGMYVNCDSSQLPASVNLSRKYSKEFIFPAEIGVGKVIYDEIEWPNPPIFKSSSDTFVAAGWFIYKGVKNNLATLSTDILEKGSHVLNSVEAGVFMLYWWDGDKARVINDPLGLSTHFIDFTSNELKVAPSVKVLYQEESHRISKEMQSVLTKKNHLFGNYTLFDGIERLSPGGVYSFEGAEQYFDIESQVVSDLSELGKSISKLASYWIKENRILPLSAGLDSRFLLANSTFEYGFTYGPENSPEINITGQYSSEFTQYYSFDFCEKALEDSEPKILEEMSYGVINPIPRLLTNYLHVKAVFPKANAFFEGYLGDVFQRGTFITFKGALGEIFKIFPWVYKICKFNDEFLLKKRYKELTSEELDLLLNDYKNKTQNLHLDDYQKVSYYEFLYGRGGRYAIFGSNILAAQVYTVVSPFTHLKIFTNLIKQDFSASVSYKSMKRLWSSVKNKYKKVKVESGYSPNTLAFVIPYIQIIYRLMFHFIPSRANYGLQQQRRLDKNKVD